VQIGELARRAAVSVDTIRFYERRGVLPEPARRPSGYRTYSDATIERIRLARGLQQLGFTLDEVIDALRSHDAGQASCQSERWRLEAVLTRLDSRISELDALRASVRATLRDCEEGSCQFVGANP
jgi:DNA-binding transcriptional MerR regulator